ncbi:MAG: PIN domain-containing protein, partial [Patescibacteria group bacterium]
MKFVILDSNAIVHRAFHAIPELTNKRGEPTGAIYGFISFFIKMINDLKPDYLVACFDLPEQTFRHKKFADYKAHRPKTPEELNAQFPKIKEFLILAGVPVLEKPGFEADDILGTISEQLYLKSKIKNQKSKLQLKIKNLEKEKENIQAIIVTGDLDTLQLINNNTEIYTMRR